MLYAVVESIWGLMGLAWLKMLLAIFMAITFQYAFSLMSGSYLIGCLLGVLTVSGFVQHFTLRPQCIAWLVFAGVLCAADRYCREKKGGRTPVVMAVLGCVWANTHLSAIVGVVGVFLWASQDHWSERVSKRPIIITGSFLLGTLISPYIGGEWLTLFLKTDHVFKFEEIAEFGRLTIGDRCAGILLFQIVLLVTLSYQNRILPSLSRIILAMGCILFGAFVVKFIPFAVICLSAMLARLFRDYKQSHAENNYHDKILLGLHLFERKLQSLQSKTLQSVGFFLVCIIIINCVRYSREPINREIAPWNAIEFVREKHLSFPVAHAFDVGGFMMYQMSAQDGSPRERVVIDGRTNVNSRDVWKSYTWARNGQRNWHDFLSTVKAKTVIWKENSPLSSLLRASMQWCEVSDGASQKDGFSVFISRDQFESRRAEFKSSDCQHRDAI